MSNDAIGRGFFFSEVWLFFSFWIFFQGFRSLWLFGQQGKTGQRPRQGRDGSRGDTWSGMVMCRRARWGKGTVCVMEKWRKGNNVRLTASVVAVSCAYLCMKFIWLFLHVYFQWLIQSLWISFKISCTVNRATVKKRKRLLRTSRVVFGCVLGVRENDCFYFAIITSRHVQGLCNGLCNGLCKGFVRAL